MTENFRPFYNKKAHNSIGHLEDPGNWQARTKDCCLFAQGIHLGKPDNCPEFMYALMKDCWQKEPEKRLEFTTISMRLKYPYHNYDVPPAYDGTEEAEEPAHKEAAEPGKVKSRQCFFVKGEQG